MSFLLRPTSSLPVPFPAPAANHCVPLNDSRFYCDGARVGSCTGYPSAAWTGGDGCLLLGTLPANSALNMDVTCNATAPGPAGALYVSQPTILSGDLAAMVLYPGAVTDAHMACLASSCASSIPASGCNGFTPLVSWSSTVTVSVSESLVAGDISSSWLQLEADPVPGVTGPALRFNNVVPAAGAPPGPVFSGCSPSPTSTSTTKTPAMTPSLFPTTTTKQAPLTLSPTATSTTTVLRSSPAPTPTSQLDSEGGVIAPPIAVAALGTSAGSGLSASASVSPTPQGVCTEPPCSIGLRAAGTFGQGKCTSAVCVCVDGIVGGHPMAMPHPAHAEGPGQHSCGGMRLRL